MKDDETMLRVAGMEMETIVNPLVFLCSEDVVLLWLSLLSDFMIPTKLQL